MWILPGGMVTTRVIPQACASRTVHTKSIGLQHTEVEKEFKIRYTACANECQVTSVGRAAYPFPVLFLRVRFSALGLLTDSFVG